MQVSNADIVDGRYRIEQEVIIPGFPPDAAPARLYNAFDEQLERPVTLQFLSASEARDPFQLQRFVRNGQMASALHHPNVAGVYDAGEWNGWPYWVMARMGDSSPMSLYESDDATPNIAVALTATRQAAEALQAVRQAGMSDWTFSHQALRVSPSGETCLYPVMGLERLQGPDADFASSAPADDPRALSGLLRLILVGTPDPRLAGPRMFALPAHVVALLDRMYLADAPGKLSSAGEVASAIDELEASALQPTEAYIPSQPLQPAPALTVPYYGPDESATVAPAVLSAASVPASTPEAPTLVAPVAPLQDSRSTTPVQARPYVPPAQATEPQVTRRPGLLPVLPLLALLLLAGAVAMLWLKANPAGGSVAGANAVATSPAQPQPAVVPDVRGKTLEEANGAIGLAGLHLGQTEPVRDPNLAANIVVRQVPDPGTPLQPGDPVTITLSLGPEPTAVPAQPAVQPNPALPAAQPNPQPRQPAPAAKPEPPGKKEKDNKDDKKKDKDKGKDH
ncbi:MAG: eukaryotic-like serine/threonine-protein kinase [Chloroflexia bacterium]|jgi:serine/threonine-protein kinase|nr:eukaryotic-like serine/threonine-protein kinase [Chloroflexia bacterium]